MSIWLWVALCAYLIGVGIEWQRFQPEIKEYDEYSNFPVVWVTQQVVACGYLFRAFVWFYDL
ncbi:hypothetical protein DSM106972_051860 [Dulcicalothrix desertica PCC 7102]|uniref:Uncharacterized protein n=1 Tax=Dulcicalothrix desertica PCC 7102 TaxID=232991 RepID=A0A3S1ALH3_9CYAN|nr:hypothetical protein [Dulcicalothrix desertica]RUT03547.1 hypothetical protein DSM106972_051860 [Dulcicalothrix desertica PCC 7102]TWH50531.1 hypothetical protein CAL7102_04853 [Dulcicalothrix desertica PCC 7102]